MAEDISKRVEATEEVVGDVAQQAFKRIDEIAELQEEHSGILDTHTALLEHIGKTQRQMQRQLNRMETMLQQVLAAIGKQPE